MGEGTEEELTRLVDSVVVELDLAIGHADVVAAACHELARGLAESSSAELEREVGRLAPLLRKRSGDVAVPLFDLLADLLPSLPDPWCLLAQMLAARDGGLAYRALDLVLECVSAGTLRLDERVLSDLADLMDAADSPFTTDGALDRVGAIVEALPGASADPAIHVFSTARQSAVRRMAARVLDRRGLPVPESAAVRVLGEEAFGVLRPYLAFTRATWLDVATLVPETGAAPPVASRLRRAEAVCGENLLRAIVAEIGWARLNLGLDVEPMVLFGIEGSLPLRVTPTEAKLLAVGDPTRRSSTLFLVRAHGGRFPSGAAAEGGSPVDRFRAYNVRHAELLADFLDVAPLDTGRIERIVARMDGIVDDFGALFGAHVEDAAMLPDVYGRIRRTVTAALERARKDAVVSAELTRRVQAFEDPASLGDVRTLHGLKRYLHQRGLGLASRLVDAARGTDRTVDLALASPDRVLRKVQRIRYVTFEDEELDVGVALATARSDREAPREGIPIPHPVAVVADGFARQLVHGHESFPRVDVHCYGNETHHYLSFRNHPAFVRIDYAPPLRGGMIDVDYLGVSNYEAAEHPNRSLDAIRLIFRELGFDVQTGGSRIRARFDKERSVELGELCRKAEMLFCLAPHLMDVDWTIGSLALDDRAKRKVAEAWADSFRRWAVLPAKRILTRDRTGILQRIVSGPAGESEQAWSGEGAYADCCSGPLPGVVFERLRDAVRDLDVPLAGERSSSAIGGQIDLEQRLLRPLREALARGELVESADGVRRPSPLLFRREHEAMRFAEILAGGDDEIASTVAIAAIVVPLEKALRFCTTGSVNGHEVQRTRLALRDRDLDLCVLRDGHGMIRLAFFAKGGALFRSRPSTEEPWQTSFSVDAARLTALLRRAHYLDEDRTTGADAMPTDATPIRAGFRERVSSCPPRIAGERVVTGLAASPGRAVGRAVLGTAGRLPAHVDGAILVAPSVGPEDNTFLYHAAGIVSTGGGILSHAGLIATQFHKPALVVPGSWREDHPGRSTLSLFVPDYEEDESDFEGFRVRCRRRLREREQRIEDGELLVVDSDSGTLHVLGGSHEALALHDDLRALATAERELSHASDERSVLLLRGRRLRALHQLEKLLARLEDPVLARHAIREIVVGEGVRAESRGARDDGSLLRAMLRNPRLGEMVLSDLLHLVGEIAEQRLSAERRALRRIPASRSLHEVLSLRVDLLRRVATHEGALLALRACGVEQASAGRIDTPDIEEPTRQRLRWLRSEAAAELREPGSCGHGLRHLLRRVERLDRLLEPPPDQRSALEEARLRLEQTDEAERARHATRRILWPTDGGFELFPWIGWKAANLAEIDRLAGRGLVPGWFVVTDRAFREVLETRVQRETTCTDTTAGHPAPLREEIDAILRRPDLDDVRKSASIRGLWEAVRIPEVLATEVAAAYRALGTTDLAERTAKEECPGPFVAIRSSTREEDAEAAARAGEFETFLFIRGESALLDYLKRAWAGLWTERAIHNRQVLGGSSDLPGGGILVQRIAWSRVSGVLLTVNVAENELQEMVLNAGLGLGEGIVSGAVAADHVTVAKDVDLDREPLRFRYVTADKGEQVVFNRHGGFGTVQTEVPYHQRLRPALEYVELRELVQTAARLEAAYGYPLDIEWGIEGDRLRILQARPVASFLAVWLETIERHPLRPEGSKPLAAPT